MENEIRIGNSLLAYDCRHVEKVMRVDITLNININLTFFFKKSSCYVNHFLSINKNFIKMIFSATLVRNFRKISTRVWHLIRWVEY